MSSPQVLVQIVELLGTVRTADFLRLPGLGGFVNDPHMLVNVGVSWKRQKLEKLPPCPDQHTFAADLTDRSVLEMNHLIVSVIVGRPVGGVVALTALVTDSLLHFLLLPPGQDHRDYLGGVQFNVL